MVQESSLFLVKSDINRTQRVHDMTHLLKIRVGIIKYRTNYLKNLELFTTEYLKYY